MPVNSREAVVAQRSFAYATLTGARARLRQIAVRAPAKMAGMAHSVLEFKAIGARIQPSVGKGHVVLHQMVVVTAFAAQMTAPVRGKTAMGAIAGTA